MMLLPLQGVSHRYTIPQGVALGYELLPLQGEAIIVLCFYILHFQFWDAAYYRVFTLCKTVKKTQVVALRDELILITRYV